MKSTHRDWETVRGPETGFLEVAKDIRIEICPRINRSFEETAQNCYEAGIQLMHAWRA